MHLGVIKLMKNYINFVKHSKKFNESESDANQFLLNRMEVTCKANTIIVALTWISWEKTFFKRN